VINAAAYTAVDLAETDGRNAANVINGASPGAMATACAHRDLPLVHYSTDFVFGAGRGEALQREEDTPAPLNVYGQSKLEGEQAILAAGARAVVIRISWVFSAHGKNFVKTMLRLASERDRLRVVSDQRGTPTPAAAAAEAGVLALKALAKGDAKPGLYQYGGLPDTTWAGFAQAVMEEARLNTVVESISSSEYPTPALRPSNSALSSSRFEAEFGLAAPDWRAGLRDVITELSGRG
jgi:dTDP-4-dehydrorhamnose reductase